MNTVIQDKIDAIMEFREELIHMQNKFGLFRLVHPEHYREVRPGLFGIGDSIENLDELVEELEKELEKEL